MKALLIVVALALAGCSTTRYAPVKCVTPDQLEQLKQAEPPKVADRLTGKADEDVRTIAGSAMRLRLYAHGLLGVVEGCTG